ncbi:transcription termination/antitermination protein NusG [Corynebacterium simulans]|uniref:transcription termination/antitermination protein NusG n=1 Tax=Corynebacterium TaxID=1716 RepID=UPI0020035B1B|nr:transcription termination/antitermination protein NusG [Corynebacterium simulans]MCK6161700.1 transcription termination/antitermination protein NusG [Corynebacterium simulans]
MSDENNVETPETSLEAALIGNVQDQAAEAVADSESATEEAYTEAGMEAPQFSEAESADAPAAEGAEAAEDASNSADAEAASAAEAEGTEDDDYRRRLRQFTRELKKQPGQWYIIQCYSGYENKVKTNLDMRAQTLEVEDSIFEVVVPVEQILENKDGKKKIVKRKLLPGYVLVRMELNDAAWSVVRETPGVTSFVGNEGNATPVKIRDVAKFLMPNEAAPESKQNAGDQDGEQVVAMPEKAAAKAYAHDFEVGEAVTILSGPLASVSATISEIDPETGKMQGLVSIFGRETPVELSPTEIERVS